MFVISNQDVIVRVFFFLFLFLNPLLPKSPFPLILVLNFVCILNNLTLCLTRTK